MNREELLKALSAAPFRAVPTVVTYDMGLQYDYMSSKGAGTGLGCMGRWPAFLFKGISQRKWTSIRNALKNNALRSRTLAGTELLSFWEDIKNDYYGGQFRRVTLGEMFSNLLTLPETVPEKLYCLFDLGDIGYEDHIPEFYDNEKAFFKGFIGKYCSYFDKWEEMSDKELRSWYRRLPKDMAEFPYNVRM